MRLVGVIHLLSALGFAVLGLYLPTIELKPQEPPSFVITCLILGALSMGMVGFAVGTVVWLAAIPKLIGNEKKDKEPKCCS